MQILSEVLEGSGADAEVRFRKVPVQWLGQVLYIPRSGSGRFRYRG